MPVEVSLVENRVEVLAQEKVTNVYSDYDSDDCSFSRTHVHEEHEICLCSTPSAISFCGESIVRLGGDFAVFYPSRVPHLQLNHPHSIYRRFFVRYPAEFLDGLPCGSGQDRFFYANLTERDMSLLRPAVDLLLLLDGEPEGAPKETEQRYLIACILSILARRAAEQPDSPENQIEKKEMLFYRICRIVHEHYSEELSLDSLAQSQFISRSTLNRLFRSMMNMSVTDYVNRVRCSYAIGFLERGLSVHETAFRCGYSDQSYFIKVFKRIHGITPRRYRENGAGQ
jgi:AraC-like DNA-binding protein